MSTETQGLDQDPAQANNKQLLDIRIGQSLSPPTNRHQLLLGFHFGNSPLESNHSALVDLHLKPLEHDNVVEAWWYQGDVSYKKTGLVRISECRDYSVAIVQMKPGNAESFRAQTRTAYQHLLKAIRSTQHTKLVKVWNYFGDITEGDDDYEKYRQFSVGREEAFREIGIIDDVAPTATAIGTQGKSGLTLVALASNSEFRAVENPRQISAFNYPREYGPSSPKFSRGGFVNSPEHKLYLISGTAAVVGHQSNFPYDTALQLTETLKNLASLCDAISAKNPQEDKFVLDAQSVLRVYIKDPQDYMVVRQGLGQQVNLEDHTIIFLQGTICREELMVEIDGIKVI